MFVVNLKTVLLMIFSQVFISNSARILSVIPSASVSHHLPFQPLWRELAQRGHHLTVITTDPQKNITIPTLKQIDASYCYKIYEKFDVMGAMSNENFTYLEIAAVLGKALTECNDYILTLPEVDKLIHTDNVKYDLVIIEAQIPSMLAFGWKFKCPVIAVASLEPALQFHDSVGNIVHPLLNPDPNLEVDDATNLTLKERIKSFLYTFIYKYFLYTKAFPKHHAHMKKYFGENLPSLKELQDNISMIFIGTHPLFHYVRPIGLSTISIGGGMHILPPKKLPQDLQKFLDGAKDGAIYFSLGSNVNSNLLTDNFKKALVEAFAEIPYKVLLKMDGELPGLSDNVLVKKWMPQQDILRHKNIKLFITQGGLQSLQESVANGVPVIGIPFFGDQITNVNKLVKKGYGLKIHRKTMTKEDLVTAIKEIIENPKYKETAEQMGEIFRDEEIPSLQRAVYWTEYVIRHKGARHLRSLAIGMPAWKFYMLDVIGCLAAVAIITFFVFYLMLKLILKTIRFLWRSLVKSNKEKVKKN